MRLIEPKIGRSLSRPLAGLALMTVLLSGTLGCAYFNTYYNAQRLYNSASKRHRQFPDTTAVTNPEKEDLKKAIDKYAEVALKYPDSRWVLPSIYNIGNAYYLRGEYDKAGRKYQEIRQYYPNSKYYPWAQLKAANISFSMKQWDKALWELSQIKTNDRDIAQRAHYLEALVLQSIPDHPRAVISWERFLYQHYRGNLTLSARYNYAACLLALNEFTNSIRELELILDSRIKKDLRYQVTMLLGQAYQGNRRYSEALSLYQGLLKRETEKTRISSIELEMANCLAQKDEAGAVRDYHLLSRKYPKTEISSTALYQIGQLYEKAQQLDSALAYYNLARNDNPTAAVREAVLKKSADISLLLAYRQQSDLQAAEQSAKLQFLMAEHYLFGLDKPDSALATYSRLARDYADQPLAPKAWFAAAWTARYRLSDTLQADSICSLLVEKYPGTRYANGARAMLDLPVDTSIVDLEPEIEMNIRPLEQRKDAPASPADSAGGSIPGGQIDTVGVPANPPIPSPNINRMGNPR